MAAIEPGAIRIEPLAQDATLTEGLRMAIADPAWMLARQRQFGELTAHDAGSPTAAAVTREAAHPLPPPAARRSRRAGH